jgi:hypothetical protein
MKRAREIAGWLLLLLQIPGAILTTPDWSIPNLAKPVYMASIGGVLTALTLLYLRRKIRGGDMERASLALFLGGMPLIYVSSWFIAPQPGWLVIEIVGVVVFGALAVLGYFKSSWFLAGGIAAHGVFWDLWHVHRQSFVPDWYAIGCMAVDVMLGLYVALEAGNFKRFREERKPRLVTTTA